MNKVLIATKALVVTPLEDIRAQVEPQIVEIPGYRKGTTINVRVQLIDVEARLLELQIGNPLLAEVQRLAQSGHSKEEIARRVGTSEGGAVGADTVRLLDEVVRRALVEPTYEQLAAIHPLTLAQKTAIFDFATGAKELAPFRDEQGV